MSNLSTVLEDENEESSVITRTKHDETYYADHQRLASSPIKTTKDLVRSFEALSSTPPAALTPAKYPHRMHRAPTLDDRKTSQSASLTREKPQSSLKRSWRNLLDIVKKDITSQQCAPRTHKKPNPPTAYDEALDLPCDSGLFTSTLLVYSLPDDRFKAYTGALENHLIILFSPTVPGTTTHSITLAGCHDVCSRSLGDINGRRRGSLCQAPELDGMEPKFFELMYADGTAELLAAGSVKERAAWVSAIWGMILIKPAKKFSFAGTNPPNLRFKDPVSVAVSDVDKPINSASALASSATLHRPSISPASSRTTPNSPSVGHPVGSSPLKWSPDNGHPLGSASPPAPPPKDTFTGSSSQTPKPLATQARLDASHKRPSVAALFKRSSVKDRINSINTGNTPSSAARQPRVFCQPPPSSVPTTAKSAPGNRISMTNSAETDYSDLDSLLDSYRSTPFSHHSETTTATAPLDASRSRPVNYLETDVSQVQEEITRTSQAVQCLSEHVTLSQPNHELNLFLMHELDIFKEEMRIGLRNLHDSVHNAQDKLAEASQSHDNRVLQEVKAAIAELSTSDDRKPEAVLGPELLRVAQTVGDMRLSMGEELQRLAHVCNNSTDHSARAVSTLDDTLAKILEAIAAQKEGPSHTCVEGCEQQLDQIINIARRNAGTAESVQQQQNENGKYLALMCAWMDAFVKYNTAKQEDISATLGQLLALKTIPRLMEDNISRPNDGGTRGLAITFPSEATAVTLDLKNLIETFHSRLEADAQARDSLYHALCQQLPARQRHDQSELLRSLGAELSAEIKGERLRFVDAMKEATSLNVHYHVEEFKSHLTREVHMMTQDVLRLQQEKDMLERRVGELKYGWVQP